MYDDVLTEFIAYVMQVVERPHESMSGLPVCPFAKKARLENKIKWVVFPFEEADLTNEKNISFVKSTVQQFCESSEQDILFVIHPDKKALTCDEVEQFCQKLLAMLPPDFICFSGHPDCKFRVGSYRRQEPYPNFQIIRKSLHDWGVDQLLKSRYYAKWDPKQLKEVLFPYPSLEQAPVET